MMPLVRGVLPLLVAACVHAADALDDVRSSFRYAGQPVHAGIVELFATWISDSGAPQVLAVDLATCTRTNRFMPEASVAGDDGWVEAVRPAGDESRFRYRFVGMMPSGTLVLQIAEGGGSGVFEEVWFLAATGEPAIDVEGVVRDRHVLRILRKVGIGDRTRPTFRIDGEHLRVDRAHAHVPEHRHPLELIDPQVALRRALTPE